MSEEIADSGGEEESEFDMDSAVDSISDSLFEKSEEVEEVIEEEPLAAAEEETEKPEEKTGKDLPASWKKDMQEKWDGIDAETQEYFLQREKQMAEGLEKDRGDANLGRTMRDVLEPYQRELDSHGIDSHEMVSNLLRAQFTLAKGTPEQRTQLINQLAKEYGVTVGGEAPQANPELDSIRNELNEVKSHLTASQKQAQQVQSEKIQSEVEAFASDPAHPLFDEVSEQIIPLINAGQDLDTAYQNAIWLNPETRQKEIDRLSNEATEKSLLTAKQEAEKARKAKATNVRGRDTNKTPTGQLGSWEDTMRETYREHNST